MTKILLILLAFFLDVLFQVIFEFLIGLGINAASELPRLGSRGRVEIEQPSLTRSFIGYFFIGIFVGMFSVIIIPSPFIRLHTVPGLSVILVPILAGLSMKMWGNSRNKKGKSSISLATFWGGAIFAFGTVLTRFILVYFNLAFWAA
jgi:hypothetical protein